jgi:SAM-dependent methyltransferase
MSAYRDDLAYIHDSGYGALAEDAAARLVDELGRLGPDGGTVVDLGCGSGILASSLVEAGYHVLGIDTSESMVALARRRAPHAEFRVDSVWTASLPRCVGVTAIGEVINYAFDPANDPEARVDLLRRVYRALAPGGVFLFDGAGPGRVPTGGSHRTQAVGHDWAVLVETSAELDALAVTRRITTFRQVGAMYRRDDEVHRLLLLDPAALLQALQEAGFSAQTIERYKAVSLPTGVTAFLARKPAADAG